MVVIPKTDADESAPNPVILGANASVDLIALNRIFLFVIADEAYPIIPGQLVLKGSENKSECGVVGIAQFCFPRFLQPAKCAGVYRP